MKKCLDCQCEKPLYEFHLIKNRTRNICKPCNISRNKKWRKENPSKLAENQSIYRQKNKARLAAYYKEWKAKNWPSLKAYLSSRKARVRKQTPPWADLNKIREIYFNRPDGHHVDHIIPIQGRNVSGLHVPWNLQYLPAIDNLKKSNKV